MINVLLTIAGVIPAENEYILIPVLLARVFILAMVFSVFFVFLDDLSRKENK